jgi:hypothetical protein
MNLFEFFVALASFGKLEEISKTVADRRQIPGRSSYANITPSRVYRGDG